jgi:HPt (histidine-containing phosphotransfer) domain-containing protein
MVREENNRVVINDPFAKRLMVRYLSRRAEDVRDLRSALVAKDFESIRKKGHNMFGSGSAYGLDRVSELGAALEKSAGNENSDAVAELIDSLDAFVGNVRVV